MALEDIAASSRAPLERGLGQQRGSESECAYIPFSVRLQDSKHVQKTVLQELPSDLCIHPQSGHFPPTKKATSHCQSFQPCPLFPKGHATLPPSKHQPAPRRVNCAFQFLLGVPTPSSSDHIHRFWIHSLECSTSSGATRLLSS